MLELARREEQREAGHRYRAAAAAVDALAREYGLSSVSRHVLCMSRVPHLPALRSLCVWLRTCDSQADDARTEARQRGRRRRRLWRRRWRHERRQRRRMATDDDSDDGSGSDGEGTGGSTNNLKLNDEDGKSGVARSKTSGLAATASRAATGAGDDDSRRRNDDRGGCVPASLCRRQVRAAGWGWGRGPRYRLGGGGKQGWVT